MRDPPGACASGTRTFPCKNLFIKNKSFGRFPQGLDLVTTNALARRNSVLVQPISKPFLKADESIRAKGARNASGHRKCGKAAKPRKHPTYRISAGRAACGRDAGSAFRDGLFLTRGGRDDEGQAAAVCRLRAPERHGHRRPALPVQGARLLRRGAAAGNRCRHRRQRPDHPHPRDPALPEPEQRLGRGHLCLSAAGKLRRRYAEDADRRPFH